MCCTGFCPLSTLPGSSMVCQPHLGLWSSSASAQPPKTHSQRYRDMQLSGSHPYPFVGSLTTYCCSLHGWEGEIAFPVKKQRWKTGPAVLCSKPYFSANLSIQHKGGITTYGQSHWSVAAISIPAYLKVLIVKLIWIWNSLWKWTRMPSLPMNIHLANPYSWFWVLLLPGHVWSLRCVLNFSMSRHSGILLTPLTLHVTGISFQAFETSFYI